MPVLYSQISHQQQVLVDFTYPGIKGNFRDVTAALLPKITANPTEEKKSYATEQYLIHYEQQINGRVFLAITDNTFSRTLVFKYLRSIRSAFNSKYPATANDSNNEEKSSNALPTATVAPQHYTAFQSTMESLMYQVNDDSELEQSSSSPTATAIELPTKKPGYLPAKGSKLYEVRQNIDDLKPVLVDSIDSVMQRGERLELLVDKAGALEDNSIKFHRSARGIKQQFFLDNVKQYGMLIGCGVVFVLFMYALFD